MLSTLSSPIWSPTQATTYLPKSGSAPRTNCPDAWRAVYRRDPLVLRHDLLFTNWQLDPVIAPAEFANEKALAAKRIKFAQPSTKLPPGTKPQSLRGAAARQPP